MNKRKNEKELEVLLISAYIEIISSIVSCNSGINSIKLLIFSYIVKKDRFNDTEIYNGRNSNYLVLKSISQLAGNYDDFCQCIKYIALAIHLLNQQGVIWEHDGCLFWNEKRQRQKPIYGKFIEKAIQESFQISDRQFLKEVVCNV